MSHKEKIQQLLAGKPGLKAQQIATELGIEKSHVATALYGFSNTELIQDSSYRWWPRAKETRADGPTTAHHPFLSRLCRYYLDCLSHESGAGISIPATSEDAEYVALAALPFAQAPEPPNHRAIRRIIQKVRRERTQLTLYIGYALRVRSIRRRDPHADDAETRLEPVLLYPIDEAVESAEELLRPATGIPMFNLEVLKNLPAVDSGNLIDEAIQLSEELGLANADEDLPQWDEIIFRLQHRRPDWDWKEDLNPTRSQPGPASPNSPRPASTTVPSSSPERARPLLTAWKWSSANWPNSTKRLSAAPRWASGCAAPTSKLPYRKTVPSSRSSP
jgi:hypothetical protein